VKTNLQFQHVKDFLESWGLHFDTPDGESTNIPYPQVYERMRGDLRAHFKNNHVLVGRFISRITDTTDGETYLAANTWGEIERSWELHLREYKE